MSGVEQMGLFWSLKSVGSSELVRLIKKDVTQPMVFSIKVFPGNQVQPDGTDLAPLAEAKVERLFMRPGLRRIRLTGPVKGTVFMPQGATVCKYQILRIIFTTWNKPQNSR